MSIRHIRTAAILALPLALAACSSGGTSTNTAASQLQPHTTAASVPAASAPAASASATSSPTASSSATAPDSTDSSSPADAGASSSPDSGSDTSTSPDTSGGGGVDDKAFCAAFSKAHRDTIHSKIQGNQDQVKAEIQQVLDTAPAEIKADVDTYMAADMQIVTHGNDAGMMSSPQWTAAQKNYEAWSTAHC